MNRSRRTLILQYQFHFLFLGGENEESTDIISVREGESINITCSIEGSENEVGTYLKTSIQPVNVVYVSRHNTSYILPALANRTKYSKEGSNLRITLHNVQESDSNIYQCSTYVKTESNHRKLFGKTTIVVVKEPLNCYSFTRNQFSYFPVLRACKTYLTVVSVIACYIYEELPCPSLGFPYQAF
uniref:Uncharacterized protein n=1 Tax=Melopsittacus undulatus TaxID=13146 RepID=A0A8V5HHB4_MELUD